MSQLKSSLSEREIELRIVKRDRDELLLKQLQAESEMKKLQNENLRLSSHRSSNQDDQ